jgi:hypothetical protein
MSFRNRHRFLDEVYNFLPDPQQISGKHLDTISLQVGLSMKEVLSWFEDETLRRSKLLARTQPHCASQQFPSSPESMIDAGPVNAASFTISNSATSQDSSQLQQSVSVSPTPDLAPGESLHVPRQARRGRPPGRQASELPSLPKAKRQKLSQYYPCVDCGRTFLAERWPEHVKRVHFPEHVWECPKSNERTGNPCISNDSKPFFRTDNFATHLRGEHHCSDGEISQLKITCKFAVVGFFHKVCGICSTTLKNREESIEHIKEHLRVISRRDSPPQDLGLSEWKEQCGSQHILLRGIHYQLGKGTGQGEGKKEERDGNGGTDGGASDGRKSDGPPDPSSDNTQKDDGNSFSDNGDFYSSPYFDCNTFKSSRHSTDYLSSTEPCLQKSSTLTRVAPDQEEPRHLCDLTDPIQSISKSHTGFAVNQKSVNIASMPSKQTTQSSYRPPSPTISHSATVDSAYGSASGASSSHLSFTSSAYSWTSDETREKGRCPHPECGRIFKDLRAHMLSHQNDRPEKCPIQTCDYHIKGFARKYDKNRHTLTHYKGTMVCGFCPGSGTAAEKSINRADVFKRHLTSVHGVEQTPPNSRRKSSDSGKRTLSGYSPDTTGKCSTCSATFSNAQDFYEHLDDCILRIVQQENPSEAINAARLPEVEPDPSVSRIFQVNELPTTLRALPIGKIDYEDDNFDENDDDFTLHTRQPTKCPQKLGSLTHSRGGVALKIEVVKRHRAYARSWGPLTSQTKTKKRVLAVFDGPGRLWKDDMMFGKHYELMLPLSDKTHVTDLDIQTMNRANALNSGVEKEEGPVIADDLTEMEFEALAVVGMG